MTTPRAIRGLCLAWLCLFASSGRAALPAGAPAIPGATTRSGVVGAGTEVLSNYYIAANGNTFDYVLLTGTSVSVTADAGQITRVLFIDLDDDIVTVEFSGAGSLTVSLDPTTATGPALPLKYNPAVKFGQALYYMKGHATITVQGANATTNVSVFSVGRVTEADQTMFRDNEVYDGVADIARVVIIADPGNSNFTQFGGLRLANVFFFDSRGVTGVSASNVAFNGPVYIGNIAAFDTAIPVLQLGSASDTRVVGGDLNQPNGRPIQTSGITNLLFVAGATSHGVALPAQTNRGQLSQAPAITSGNSATFTSGEAGSFTAAATGFPAPTFSVTSGALPSWATLNATTGVISGTPPNTTGSPFTFTLQASNGNGSPATQSFTLTVLGPVVVAPLSNQTVTAGNSATWTASITGGGSLTYQWRRDGQPIAGATSASYTIAAVTMFDAASYDVVVTRGASKVVAAAAVLSVAPTQYPGTMRVDPTFTPSIETDGGTVFAIARQSDGKLVIGGQFARINGVARSNLARLNADGTVDTSFAPGTGPNDTVWKLALQPDGNILIAGDFVSYNGTTRGHIARVRPNGLLDATFDPGWGANGQVLGLGLQPDGKVLLGGAFSTIDGMARGRVARLNASGSLDATFNPGSGASGAPTAFAVQSDGKILIGGGFERFTGVSRVGVARLNADGSLDTTFVSDTGGAWGVTSLALQADGKILVGAFNFSSPAPNLQRLNADGSRDTSFNPGANNGTYAIAVQGDGKIVIGGRFALINGATRNHVARYLTDGTLDSSFDAGNAVDFDVRALALEPDGSVIAGGGLFGSNCLARVGASGASDATLKGTTRLRGTVWDAARQPDGKILLVGAFAYVNGVACRGIARLLADGTLDTGFNVGSGPNSAAVEMLALQPDGRILVGGGFTTFNGVARKYLARLAADGAVDTTFDAGSGPDGQVNALALQPDGKILIGGSFTAYNGTSRSRVARLTAGGAIDASFNPGLGPDNSVDLLALQADGRILLSGSFTSYNGTSRAKLARIAADGSLDTGFVPSLPAGSSVSGMLALPDGKTVLSVSGSQSLVRLQSNGSADSSFAAGNLATTFYTAGPMLPQADGRLLAGRMLNVSGTFSPAPPGIARLGTNGVLDTTFSVPGLSDAAFSRIIMLENGGLLVAGSRFNDGTVDQAGIARLVNVPTTALTNPLGSALGSSHSLFDGQYLGTRFVLASPLRVTSIRADLTNANNQNLFVAIVRLSSLSSFPTASSTTGLSNLGEVVFSTLFNPGTITGAITPVTIPVSVTLNAGPYAVVFGVGLFGSPGGPSGLGGADGGMQNYSLTTGSDTLAWVSPSTTWHGPHYDAMAQGTPTYGIALTGTVVSSVAPAITMQPSNQTVIAGASTTFTSGASGTPAPVLQWQRQPAGTTGFANVSDGGSYSGATTATLTVSNTTVAMGGDQFRCVASNGVPIDAISTLATLTVHGAPTITALSAPRQVVTMGQNLMLSATATSDGAASYQWKRNGQPIAGATAAAYTITGAVPLRDNGWYQVVVTNAYGATTSAVVFVNVAVAQSQIVAWGSNSEGQTSVPAGLDTVTAIAAGFYHSLALKSDGTVVAWGAKDFGPTNVPAGLSGVVAIAAASTGSFALKSDGTLVAWGRLTVPAGLTDVVAIATTDYHSLALKSDGTVVAWGANYNGQTNVPAGLTGVVGIAAAGNSSLAVKSDGTVVAWGSNLYGQANVPAGLTGVVAAALADRGFALKANGSVTIWGAGLELGQTRMPDGLTGVAALSARGTGSLALMTDGTVGSWGGGALAVPAGLRGVLAVALGNAHALALRSSTTSGAGAPLITPHPQSLSVTAGEDAMFTIAASGTPAPTLRWQRQPAGTTGFANVSDGGSYSGATTATLAVSNTTVAMGGDQFRCVASNGVPPDAISNPATLTVTIPATAPTITMPPASQSIASGQTATLSVVATGAAPLSYQWCQGTSPDTATPIFGATEASYTTPALTATTSYWVRVSNAAGLADSATATVSIGSVAAAAALTSENVAGYSTGGGTATLRVRITYTGETPLAIGATIALPTGWTFASYAGPSAAAQPLAGDTTLEWAFASFPANELTFTFTVDYAAGQSGNKTITGSVDYRQPVINLPFTALTFAPFAPPVIATRPASQGAGVGAGVTFTVAATGTGPFTYQWKKNGVNVVNDSRITGATTATLSIGAVTLADAGSYSVVVTNAVGSVTSDATLAVLDARGSHAVVDSGYIPGGTVTITNTITYAGELTALGWEVLLPMDWSYASGGGTQADVTPDVGTTWVLEWAWVAIPASPITFTYTLKVPAGASGTQTIAALMLLRQGVPCTMLVKPDPLVIDQVTYHAADTNKDGKISLTELLRVIELYNTRNGTVRTGCYAVDAVNLEDGFATDAARLNTAVAALAKYHSADSNRDGKLSLTELLRVIELYNHRSGTVRTGQYHVQANTEDGFDPGPAP